MSVGMEATVDLGLEIQMHSLGTPASVEESRLTVLALAARFKSLMANFLGVQPLLITMRKVIMELALTLAMHHLRLTFSTS